MTTPSEPELSASVDEMDTTLGARAERLRRVRVLRAEVRSANVSPRTGAGVRSANVTARWANSEASRGSLGTWIGASNSVAYRTTCRNSRALARRKQRRSCRRVNHRFAVARAVARLGRARGGRGGFKA